MKLSPSEMFKALAVETRIRIINILKSRGPLGAKNIARLIGVTPAAISQHLKILRQTGMVRSKRNGYWIPYSIDEETLENCRCVLNEVCTCGCKEPSKSKEKEINRMSLESLRKYERMLENKIKTVQERIKEKAPQRK